MMVLSVPIIQGPICEPRNTEREKKYSVDANRIHPAIGTPVVCCGLDKEFDHLNGNIGDVRENKRRPGFVHIYFEDKSLSSCEVQLKNEL